MRLLLPLVLLCLRSGEAVAQAPAGPSYWGPLPAESDSTTAAFEGEGLSAWEWPLYAPWKVVELPFEALNLGVKYGIRGMEASGASDLIAKIVAGIDIPYGASVSVTSGGLTGTGGTLKLFHNDLFHRGVRSQIKVGATTRDHWKTSVGFIVPTRERGDYLSLGAGYRIRPNARFFGIGPAAPEDAESYYTQEAGWAGLAYDRFFSRGFSLEGTLVYTRMGTRGPREPDEYRSVDELFSGNLPQGYGELSHGLLFALSLQQGDADQPARPRRGGIRRFVTGYYVPSSEDESGFSHYRVDVQQFFPLWYDRAFAARWFAAWIVADAEDVHFERLMTNDDPDQLRGYDDFRWRDRGMTALQMEYRFPVWANIDPKGLGVDAYLFFDWGQVYGKPNEVALNRLTESYGFGFRLAGRRSLLGRLEFAFSKEETVVRLSTDQVFQFAKGGIFHGRNPSPPR